MQTSPLTHRLRSEPGAPMLLLPVAHLSFIVALVWVFSRIDLHGSTLAQGVKLVVKQLLLELGSSLILGATIVAVSGKRQLIRI